MSKKTWTAPTVEELGIDATLGGVVTTKNETVITGGAPFGPGFGTIPGTGPY